jgi:hypothetical protein
MTATPPKELRPMFGAHALQPDGLSAVYGGRWIVKQDGYTDLVPDRHGVEGDESTNNGEALMDWLNHGVEGRGKGALQKAREGASDLLKRYVMKTREAQPFILYQDGDGVIVGNTNGSCGYLYVTGWLYDDLPEGTETCGLEKWLVALGIDPETGEEKADD